MDVSTTGLRVLREIAERGSFTAAAVELGYTQSAVSRQVAVLERETGAQLFERHQGGARLTVSGLNLLRHARVVLDELDAATRELDGGEPERAPVRLGLYVSAGPVLLPRLVPWVRREHPTIDLTTREGTSPSLARSVRAGTLDLAVVVSRPPHRAPDDELPALDVDVLGETGLMLAVPESGRFGGRSAVHVDELAGVDWIASPSTGAESLLGVWPGLAGHPRIAHSARDWLTKLTLVGAGCGVTTVAPGLATALPSGVRLVAVEGVPAERRRMSLIRLPGAPSAAVETVARAIRDRQSS